MRLFMPRVVWRAVFAASDPVAMDLAAWWIGSEKWPISPSWKTGHGPKGLPRRVLSAERLGLGTADSKCVDHVVKRLS